MSSARDGLKQVVDFARPRTVRALAKAGALHPSSSIALAGALPWLIGRGPSLGVVTQMNSQAFGTKTAIHDRNGSISWRELDNRANQAAHALWNSGLRGNDRVATLLRNGRECIEVALGAQKYGIVACPLNTWAKPKELKATMAASDPGIVVYDTAHADQVKECVPEDVPLVFVGDERKAIEGSIDYEEWLSDKPQRPPAPFTRNPGSAKVVIHTSGTTGTPKGAARNASAAGLGALSNLLSVVPYHRSDIVFCPAPLFHSFGLATFTFATALGATMVLPEKFDPEQSLALIEAHQATAASFVPVMIKRIVSLDDDVKKRYDVSSLRIVMASGSAMGAELRRAAFETFGKTLYDLYGSTEAGWVAIARPEDIESHPNSVGKPVPGIDVAIFDKEGDRLDAGETGEIYVKSEVLFEGYTSGDAKDERDGYMSIGDLGHLDPDGYLYIEGRADDMVVVGGENIYPIEIEQVIEGIPGVDEVTVMGVPDEEYGEVLAAFVVGSVTPAKVKETCKKELASYKVPKRVEIIKELPRTSTGKVVKRELVEIAEDNA
ncbi:MAG: AMP-binding protein [Actinomycetota bacterium]|nr:AMP-binding protein [Actinomycetota bacterium]